MKMVIMYVCLGVLTAMVISLSLFIRFRVPVCDRPHMEDIRQLWGRADAVPDEVTARRISDAVIDAQSGFGERQEYDVTISFDEGRNSWSIYYQPTPLTGFGGGISIGIRRDNGMISGLAFLP